MYAPPADLPLSVHAELPDSLRMRDQRSEWADANRNGARLHSFLEGPAFDRSGALYLVDIPFGRILRLGPDGTWDVLIRYDGWPNGLRVHRDGSLWIADRRN
ncbi:MAG: SMP-30/gluconolactonase/LRE family protein, partial [Burkholderiales bacterium]